MLDEGTVRELVEGVTGGEWIANDPDPDSPAAIYVRDDSDEDERGEFLGQAYTGANPERKLFGSVFRGRNHGKNAALMAASKQLAQTALSLYSRISELEARVQAAEARAEAAEKERFTAVQILIDTVQVRGGEICQDWSSWRVGFGRGVSRGYGQTDDQQIVSAVAQAIGKPDPYAPNHDAAAQAGAGGEG